MADIFLKKYMSEFIQKIRNPMGLADDLYAKNFIQKEMYQNIKTQETNLRKTREIYESLNSTKHYDFMCDWLKENESDVFEELELLHRKRDTEAEAPQKKKARLENEDETDFTIFPDLKRISTFAKLERWVSEPEISQKLISDLERQLGDNGMADLKKKLKDKEPKNILCFNANNIDNIRKNKELDKFLSKTNNTEIPKLTFSMFFKKGGSVSSGNNAQSSDMQETRIHEMKEQPQRFNVPNVPRHIDVSLSQYDPFTKKEPLEDGLGSTDMKEPWTDKIDEQLKRSNVPMHKEESRYQKDQITKKETPLEDGLGSTDMQNTHNDKIDEEHQKSNVPMHAACLHQDESIIKNKMPLEDRCGNMNMQHNEQANMQVNPEPFSSKQLQDNSPGSASKYTQSNSTEFLAQYKNTAILAPNRDVKDQTEATKKREKSKCQKEKKKKSKDDLLLDWAMRQCNDRKDELKNILDQISIINMAEHSDYPCFTAENVMVYKYLTPESQIIFIADDSSSISTMTMVHYHMFVCNIKKAILLGPKKQDEQEIQYIESKVPVDTCTGFIFKAFAPALTVYKKIQKEEKLYSLI